ncbi:MAG: Gar1/Naf1 family protein [Candidatus Methanomethylophilaceae archaeon]
MSYRCIKRIDKLIALEYRFMDLLGVVEELGSNGNLIIRGVTTPDVGNSVYDSKERKIGSVKRIFGPVESPYITVIPLDKSALKSITDKKVYFKVEAKHGKDKRKY